MHKKLITLSDEQKEIVEKIAREKNKPETEVIKEAIDNWCVSPGGYSEFMHTDLSFNDFTDILSCKTKRYSSPFNRGLMIDAFKQLEEDDIRVAEIHINPDTYTVLRTWTKDLWDPTHEAALLRRGMVGTMWGTMIFVSRKIPVNVVLLLSEKEYRKGLIATMKDKGVKKVVKALDACRELKAKMASVNETTRKLEDAIGQL